MNLFLSDLDYRYEMENLCRLFFPHERIEVALSSDLKEGDLAAWAGFSPDGTKAAAAVLCGGQRYEGEQTIAFGPSDEAERCLGVALYRALCAACKVQPAWGILTGVRPAKLFATLAREQGDMDAAQQYMEQKLLVSPDKTALCRRVAEAESRCAGRPGRRDYSLYLSIPFCPTRCAYCSFVSHSIEKAGKLLPGYLDALERELQAIAGLADSLSLRLKTVYIGGGTPTTLSAGQLARLMEAVRRSFDLRSGQEFTVEAGRPDTITREKLTALKEGGVTRLAVNPQTLDDRVLEAIGRRHTAAQTMQAFALARECGFDNINMDLIAGLPLDTLDGFARTLDGVLSLAPEGITVHTLSMKRSSSLAEKRESLSRAEQTDKAGPAPDGEERGWLAADMQRLAGETLDEAGYAPYYLYRQSKMLGNLENVGWSLPGYEGLYNIYMMNELHTVLGAGAGAVTRLKDPESGNIERVFNFKYPYEYIGRFDEMLHRKQQIRAFYDALDQADQ